MADRTINRDNTIFSIIVLFSLSLLIMLPQLLTVNFFSCFISDTLTYTSWSHQFIESLKEGIIYPRWTPLNFWGYGSPTFVLYPPFAFYLVSFFNVFTNSLVSAMNITKFTALFLSGIGMYFLVREFYSNKIALLSASFYILFPFNIFQIYLGASFATPIALIWLSPILICLYRYFKERSYRYILLAGIFYGGLILTHLIIAYMFTLIIIAFILYMSVIKKNAWAIICIPIIISAGLLVSAAYSFPLFYERQFLNLKAFGDGFIYSDFFILPDLTHKIPQWHFWPVLREDYSLYTIVFCLLLLLFFFQNLRLKRTLELQSNDMTVINRFFLGMGIGCLFFLFGVSRVIWESMPFIKTIQYPVRWFTIAFFALSFLSAIGFQALFGAGRMLHRKYLFLLIFVCLSCTFLNYKYIRSAHTYTEEEILPVKPVNWALEHLPLSANIRRIDRDDEARRAEIMSGNGKYEVKTWKSAERIIEISAQEPFILRIRTFDFPGWEALLDDMPTDIRTEEDTGAILVDIPKGEHILVLRFKDTPVRHFSKIISPVFFVGFLLTTLFHKKRQRYE